MGVKFIPGIYHINHTVMKNMNGSGFQRKYIWMGMVFKNIKHMNGGCFENLSGTFVPKNIGRDPPGKADHPYVILSICALNELQHIWIFNKSQEQRRIYYVSSKVQ